jgi:hypothetical protein
VQLNFAGGRIGGREDFGRIVEDDQ